MLTSAQPVFCIARRAYPCSLWIPGERCHIGRQRSTDTVLEEYGISIADAKSGAVEASYSQ
jgi:hypothetical protein